LPQVLSRLDRPIFRSRSVLFTTDFLLRRKFHRDSAKRHGLSKVALIFARSGAMVDCAAQKTEATSTPAASQDP
jgi:hypothetical protein